MEGELEGEEELVEGCAGCDLECDGMWTVGVRWCQTRVVSAVRCRVSHEEGVPCKSRRRRICLSTRLSSCSGGEASAMMCAGQPQVAAVSVDGDMRRCCDEGAAAGGGHSRLQVNAASQVQTQQPTQPQLGRSTRPITCHIVSTQHSTAISRRPSSSSPRRLPSLCLSSPFACSPHAAGDDGLTSAPGADATGAATQLKPHRRMISATPSASACGHQPPTSMSASLH